MKALVLIAAGRMEYQEMPEPRMQPNEVLIRVKACAIGEDDVAGLDGRSDQRVPPLIMGHEASGVVEQVGGQVRGWQPGDRVAFESLVYSLEDRQVRAGLYHLADEKKRLGVSCLAYRLDGAMAELIALPGHLLHRIPDSVRFDQAALAEPAAQAAHALRLTPPNLNQATVVIGCGVAGLLLIQLLSFAGAAPIIAVDPDEERRNFALDAGADEALSDDAGVSEGVRHCTAGFGVASAFDTLGRTETLQTAIDCLDVNGVVNIVGFSDTAVQAPVQRMVERQLRLQGSCGVCGEFPAVLDMIARRTLDVDSLQSIKAPLSDGALWFDKLIRNEQKLLKVILHP